MHRSAPVGDSVNINREINSEPPANKIAVAKNTAGRRNQSHCGNLLWVALFAASGRRSVIQSTLQFVSTDL
jgi:hypothetical protein